MSTRRARARRKAGGPAAWFRRLLKVSFVLICIGAAVVFGYASAAIWKQMQELPDIAMVERYEPIEAIQLFDRNDHLICTVEGDEDRRVVPLTQVSPQMQQAILAAEDHHFYEHKGINVMSTVRAALANLQAHKVVEGGSTITQQLVKNLFFTDAQRTMDRKIKEAFMAYQIEQHYEKGRILQMYLNQVYFGNNAYGIERAASRYFDQTAATLDLAQAAFLAGLVKAPSDLGDASNRQAAIDRQHEIIDKMVEYGYITPDQAAKAKKEKLAFKKGVNPLQKYPYYVSYVLELLHDRFSQSEMRRQGLRVYTNLDPSAENIAEKTLNECFKKTPKGMTQGALVSVNVSDGAVIAMVGGVGNFWTHQFNRATNPHTAGSSFKPYVYLTALLKGVLTPDSLVEDDPITIHTGWGLPDWSPKNFDKKFLGKIPMRKALALSRNVCSVRIAQLVGIDSVIETAREAGITTKLEPNLSLALGSSAVSPLDQAGAYATFARMGVTIKPQVLRRIENNRGQVIEVFEAKVDRAFPVEPVARLVDMMQDVVKFGTGTQAKLPDRPVAGKTGTADAGKDIWFIGFTPDMCTAVWGGNDENKEIPGQHVTGGDVMAKIWKTYMLAYYDAHPTPGGSFVAPTQPNKDDIKKDSKMATKDTSPSHDLLSAPQTPALDSSITIGTHSPASDSSPVHATAEPEKINVNPPASGALEQPKPSPQLLPLPSAIPAAAPQSAPVSGGVPLSSDLFSAKSSPHSASPGPAPVRVSSPAAAFPTPAPTPAPATVRSSTPPAVISSPAPAPAPAAAPAVVPAPAPQRATTSGGGAVALPADSFSAGSSSSTQSSGTRLYPYTQSSTLRPANSP